MDTGAKTRKKSSDEIREFKGRALQVYEDGRPLTQTETARILSSLTWEHAELLGKGQPEEISGKCVMESYAYVGAGTCIAKKFLKWGRSKPECGKCKSTEIVDQLNYIFRMAFDSKYYSEWRTKRTYTKKK